MLGHPGAALAPWNVTRHRIRAVDRQLMVDDRPLVAYHFARFLPVFRHFFVPVRRGWIPRSALQLIYRPYMQTIRFALDSVTSINPDYRPGYTGRNMRGLLLATLAGRGKPGTAPPRTLRPDEPCRVPSNQRGATDD